MKSNGLELYAAIEDMLDFSEAIDTLYSAHRKMLRKLDVKAVLDIGCGSGAFGMSLVDDGYDVFGIDVSEKMVENSKKAGLKAEHINLCELSGSYDAATAVFDVLNYMDENELSKFFGCVRNVLKKDGYFLADVNSFYGFDEVAQGVIAIEKEDRYAVLEAEFDGKELITDMKLFTRENSGLYKREEGSITQYYHDKKSMQKLSGMKIVEMVEIGLYGEKPDKYLYVFKNA
jgi:cyclopropane fatty-acyl-phospholipid synthase-like methyltransferase